MPVESAALKEDASEEYKWTRIGSSDACDAAQRNERRGWAAQSDGRLSRLILN